jgi:hypothetical protein
MNMPRDRARRVILSLVTSESLQDRVISAYGSAFVNLQTDPVVDKVLAEGLRDRVDAVNERLSAGAGPWGGDHLEKAVRAMPELELEDCAEEMTHIALEVIERLGEQSHLASR